MEKEMQEKMNYCLNCISKPCSKNGCPLHNDIPAFIQLAKEGKIEEAYQVLSKTTVLGSVCGRICPHKKQCEGSCVRGIKGKPVSIGEIEAYVFDNALENVEKKEEHINEKKVAVVGGGPAGLTCSGFLARKGVEVTIYEKYDELGGILSHGIPKFRLPKEVVTTTINSIINQGIKVKFKQELGKNIKLENLQKEYDAVFLSFGANIPKKMHIEGEELDGVVGGNTLLELGNYPNFENKRVAVSGGGNVAIDCARTIKKLGAKEVMVIYRRSEAEMPAEQKEIEDAKKEGVQFLFQNNIVKIIGNKKVEKIECIKTELIAKEGETRKVPVNIPNSNYTINIDYIIMAVGSSTEIEILNKEKLPQTSKKYIQVNENYQIEGTNIFAGGDLIGTTATVAWAASDGRKAADYILKYLENKKSSYI